MIWTTPLPGVERLVQRAQLPSQHITYYTRYGTRKALKHGPSLPRQGQRRNTTVVKAVFVPSAARAAYRLALVYVLPGRRVLMTASRMAGGRVILLALLCLQLVLSFVLYLEKRFGLKDKITRTLSYKTTIDTKIQDIENKDGMLRAILNKTRRNLSSMSTIDSSDDEQDDTMYNEQSRQAHGPVCPLCGGTGKIDYEGKLKHTNEPCPRCLGSGHL